MKRFTAFVVTALTIFAVGCDSSTPAPTDEGKKAFMGRKPTEEELKEVQAQAAERMKQTTAGGPPAGAGN